VIQRTPDRTDGTAVPDPGTPSVSATPRATPTSTPSPRPSPAPSRDPNAAPRSAAEFDLGRQSIEIQFPLGEEARYWYRDNFMRRRAGDPVGHNHARLSSDGQMVRLHDGIDIYGAAGEPIVAPFSGQVVDPQSRWQPWSRERYGVTVVVISDEPLTDGYAAVMVHLDRAMVRVGDRVERGEVVGLLGASGNADGDGIHPHLHFELRAPFALDWSDVGEERSVDAFNPFPSLVRADPQR
jgi:murein DD-endopeptidase MepM/ murein hydrolase activator NlpD